ncbi:hypothetical protein KSP40_PGU006475 [Platanthera guangdongensis]|uniref:Uncharacterized protein n=1 Tax=Platanthera guangdongensis TaxID=2320717 RepID=A0ABR2LSL0_9ASPA
MLLRIWACALVADRVIVNLETGELPCKVACDGLIEQYPPDPFGWVGTAYEVSGSTAQVSELLPSTCLRHANGTDHHIHVCTCAMKDMKRNYIRDRMRSVPMRVRLIYGLFLTCEDMN